MANRCRKGQVMIRGNCYKDDRKKYGIIMATPVVEREGCLPQRIVLRDMSDQTYGAKYVTHHQCWVTESNNVYEPHFFWGHYFTDKNEAVKDFNKRARDL